METIFEKYSQRVAFPAMRGDTETDVLIIGGGMAGLLCAYMLEREGMKYALVEQDEICGGTTAGTTAKITSMHGLIYDKIICTYGRRRAALYLEANERAIEEYKRLAKEYPCELEECDSFVYTLSERRKLEREVRALGSIGKRAELVDSTELPFKVAAAIRTEGQARFNALKFAFGIAQGLNIFEHTRVEKLCSGEVITNRGRIRFKKAIVATHFPFINRHGLYFLKMHQHRSYSIAIRGADNVEGIYIDEAEGGFSFRRYADMLLIGGGGHRTGAAGGGYGEIERFIKKHYREYEEVCRFAAQDCITLDGIPYIGKYSIMTQDIYVATGFNKWGMSSSMVAALLLTDLIKGRNNPYAEVFSPSRSIIHPMLFSNIGHTALGLLTPSTPRCSHLGCALKYNKAEHTWDCPCHGSRYTKDGKVLENPARYDKKL